MFSFILNQEILQQAANQLPPYFSTTGNIRSEQNLYVAGLVEGKIDCKETVFIAENAEVRGEIWAKNILIYGKVGAMLRAEQIIAVADSAQIFAQLYCAKLMLSPNAVLPNGCYLQP
jgi:cytoskeletal protein CcmA (bactofilin family)